MDLKEFVVHSGFHCFQGLMRKRVRICVCLCITACSGASDTAPYRSGWSD